MRDKLRNQRPPEERDAKTHQVIYCPVPRQHRRIQHDLLCALRPTGASSGRTNNRPIAHNHFDRAKHRKCWYLGTIGMTVSEAEAPAGQSGSAPIPTVSTLLSALFSGMIGTATKGTPQDANIRQPRIIQPDSRKCRTFTTHDGTRSHTFSALLEAAANLKIAGY
jgi:hypothetical protein